jgi:hypothetical protein
VAKERRSGPGASDEYFLALQKELADAQSRV